MKYRVYVYAEDKKLAERKEFKTYTEALGFATENQTNNLCVISETDKQGNDYRIKYNKDQRYKGVSNANLA